MTALQFHRLFMEIDGSLISFSSQIICTLLSSDNCVDFLMQRSNIYCTPPRQTCQMPYHLMYASAYFFGFVVPTGHLYKTCFMHLHKNSMGSKKKFQLVLFAFFSPQTSHLKLESSTSVSTPTPTLNI